MAFMNQLEKKLIWNGKPAVRKAPDPKGSSFVEQCAGAILFSFLKQAART